MALRHRVLFFLLFTFLLYVRPTVTFSQSAGAKLVSTYNAHSQNLPNGKTSLQNKLAPLLKKSEDQPYSKIAYFLLLGEGLKSIEPLAIADIEVAFDSAVYLARASQDKAVVLWTINKIGYNLYRLRKLSNALPYFLEGKDLNQVVTEANKLDKMNYYKQNGFFWSTFGYYDESIAYLRSAEKYAKDNLFQKAELLDNIGLVYLSKGDTLNAKTYFLEASNIAKTNNDKIRYAKTLGNLATILEKEGFLDSAIAYLQKDISISESLKEHQNYVFASIMLAKFFLRQNELEKASLTLARVDKFLQGKENLVSFKIQITKLSLDIAVKNSDTDKELFLRRQLDSLYKKSDNWDGEEVIQNAKWLAEKHKLEHEINEISATSNMRIVLSGACLLITLGIAVFFLLKKKKNIEEQQTNEILSPILFQEHINSDWIDNNANISLTTTEFNNSVIENSTHLDSLDRNVDFVSLLTSDLHLNTEEKWLAFKKKFQMKYPEFCAQMHHEFPEINATYLRYIILFKLGYNKYEVVNILGVSLEAIKKNRQRLKTKLGDERFKRLMDALGPNGSLK